MDAPGVPLRLVSRIHGGSGHSWRFGNSHSGGAEAFGCAVRSFEFRYFLDVCDSRSVCRIDRRPFQPQQTYRLGGDFLERDDIMRRLCEWIHHSLPAGFSCCRHPADSLFSNGKRAHFRTSQGYAYARSFMPSGRLLYRLVCVRRGGGARPFPVRFMALDIFHIWRHRHRFRFCFSPFQQIR